MAEGDERLAFDAEWFDEPASLHRRYTIFFFPSDETVEIFDVKNRRTFLRRTAYPGLRLADLVVGNTVTIYARQYAIHDLGDEFTRQRIQASSQRTLAMIKPDAYAHMGKILDAIYGAGLSISRTRTVRLERQDAELFYAEHKGKPFFTSLIDFVTSGVVVAMELLGSDSIRRWRELIGPTSTEKARQTAPESLRARFGTDNTRNAVHGSDSPASATRECGFFFEHPRDSTATFDHATLCLIRPHAVASGHAGKIIDRILEAGLEISALQMHQLTRSQTEEFLEVYRTVLPDFQLIVEQLMSGPCIALEVRQEDAVQQLRELCGPYDPEIARILRPGSLRAHFGVDKVKNAVHATDLPEDGLLEVQYFFSLLS